MRVCRRCNTPKPDEEYKGPRAWVCLACLRQSNIENARRWRQANPERHRANVSRWSKANRQHRYEITNRWRRPWRKMQQRRAYLSDRRRAVAMIRWHGEEIRAFLAAGETMTIIANHYGVRRRVIRWIVQPKDKRH